MNESILEIIGDAHLKKGLFKKDTYRLIFTEERVLFSHVTKEARKEEQKQLKEEMKGKKFKEKVGAMFHVNERIYKKYEQLSLEEILSMGTDSFSLPYKNIRKVKRHIMTDEESNNNQTKVVIVTTSEKLKLSFSDETAATKIYKKLKNMSK